MKWGDIKNLLGNAAPLLGTALGGPVGGVAGSLIAKALGVEESPEAVAAEIKRDPMALVKLRELESNERIKIQELALETLQTELKDTQDARKNHQHSKMPAIICIALTFMVAGAAYLIFALEIPDGNKEIAYMLFGSLVTKWGDSIAYWVGTTRSSAQKTLMLKP